jgi:cell cycle sensor histidine kinase DivJ
MGALIDQVVAQHAMQADARGVTLRAEVEPIPDAMLDELALVRILSNLVGNALRYSEAGSAVVITAALDGDAIRLEVGDSGPGIGAEQRAQIGQPYVAAPRTHGGAGLGLYIVRSLVEAHGGSLVTISEAGKGTRFTVRLPLAADTGLMSSAASGANAPSSEAPTAASPS